MLLVAVPTIGLSHGTIQGHSTVKTLTSNKSRKILSSLGYKKLSKAWLVSGIEEQSIDPPCVISRTISTYSKPMDEGQGIYRTQVIKLVGEIEGSNNDKCKPINVYQKTEYFEASFSNQKTLATHDLKEFFYIGDKVSDSDLAKLRASISAVRSCIKSKKNCNDKFHYVGIRKFIEPNLKLIDISKLGSVFMGHAIPSESKPAIVAAFGDRSGYGIAMIFDVGHKAPRNIYFAAIVP